MNMHTKTNSESTILKIVKYHLPAILYAAGIIAVSSISNLKISRVNIIAFDKIIHFMEYAIFAFLIFRSIYNVSPRITLKQTLLISALFLSFFALTDEIVQHFIPGRQSELWDLLADISGSIIVLTLCGLWYKKNSK